jgi:hypothetical protein
VNQPADTRHDKRHQNRERVDEKLNRRAELADLEPIGEQVDDAAFGFGQREHRLKEPPGKRTRAQHDARAHRANQPLACPLAQRAHQPAAQQRVEQAAR